MQTFPIPARVACSSSGPRSYAVRILGCVSALVASLTCHVSNAQEARVVEAGPHHRIWETIRTEVDAFGTTVLSTNALVELATGLNYWNEETRRYEETEETFEITPQGYAMAPKGPYRLIIAPNVNEPGSIDLWAPDGQRFRSNPMGLSFHDLATGKNVLIAEVKDCIGELVASNVIVFPDAFDGVRGALKYTYTRNRFEQDVILYENPPLPPEFDPGTTVLEMYTEFFDPPEPETVPVEKARGLIDENLEFGAMRIGEGSAYVLNDNSLEPVETLKTWARFSDALNDRQFLIEAVPYATILPLLERVPWAARGTVSPGAVARGRQELVQRMRVRGSRGLAGLLAGIKPGGPISSPAVILDYPQTLTGGLTNYILEGNKTYYVGAGGANLYGTTILEPCVVKYTNSGNASLTIHGPLDCRTSLYRSAIFCAKDDNSVGETVSGSTGTPSGSYANPALQLRSGNTHLRHVRIAHAQLGVHFYDYSAGASNAVSHAQFVDCEVALQFNGYGTTFQAFGARNLLLDNCDTAFKGYSFNGTVEHLTLNGASFLAHDYKGQDYGTTSSLSVRNSLLVDLGSYYDSRYVSISLNAPYTQVLASPDGVFDQAGAGHHYLAASSPYRGAGTDSVSPELREELRHTTTYPPLELTTDLTASTTLWPQAPRATVGSSLGYHYPVLDYLWSGLNLTNAKLTLTNGVVVGIWGNNGMTLRTGARLISEGTPLQPNRLVSMNAVQEHGWSPASGGSVLSLANTIPEVRLRYTDVSVTTGPKALIGGLGANVINTLEIAHSELHGVSLNVYAYASGMAIELSNSLFDRSAVTFYQPNYTGYYPFALSAYNCLFHRGSLSLTYDNPFTTWTLQDNLFDVDSLVTNLSYSLNVSNNGYRNGLASLGGTANKMNLTPDYQLGPLGRFYYPASGSSGSLTNLYDAGNRYSGSAGLYHHTTRLDQGKEGGSMVDIGYHYAAVAPTTNGLVGYWKLDENAGSVTADASGHNHLGTLYNSPTWIGGKYGAALWFGIDSYVRLPSSPQHTFASGDFTLSAWVKPDSGGSVIAKGGGASAGTTEYILHVNGQGFFFRGAWRTSSALSVPTGVWTHVAVVYTATNQTLQFYKNGTLVGSTVVSGSYATNTSYDLFIGRQGAGVQNNLRGLADEIRIYGRALAANEIVSLCNPSLWDQDGDGLPDYLEDRNGDGSVNGGETDWTTSNSGVAGSAGLQVFTPLK